MRRFKLVLTCYACPEQYEVYHDGKVVGYIRLRHGKLYAQYPGAGGETVYEAKPRGDGRFEDEQSRVMHLNAVCRAIDRAMGETGARDESPAYDLESGC